MLHFEVMEAGARRRLDRFLADRMPESSRSRIQEWIRAGRVRVNGEKARASLKLEGGELVQVEPAAPEPLKAAPEDLPLDILYEDDDLVAVNKPAGMTVHAGAGKTEGTLVNALLHRFERLSGVGGELRPGIVHRLDRFTSGVLLVAKHDRGHRALAKQFQSRTVSKTYLAIVHGYPDEAGKGRAVFGDGVSWIRLEMPLARSRRNRVRMTPRREGRFAQTDFRVLSRSQGVSYVEVRIATGRTHQIRAHFAAIGRPVVGDRMYGAPASDRDLTGSERFFLHSWKIGFSQPSTGERTVVEAPPPPEFAGLRKKLGL